MRTTRGEDRGIRIWLRGSDKYLHAHGFSLYAARQMLFAETGITISAGAFHRRVMLARTCGHTRWWRGHSKPLPSTNQTSGEGVGLLLRAADLPERLPGIDWLRETPAFVARALCHSGFPCSPAEAEMAINYLRSAS